MTYAIDRQLICPQLPHTAHSKMVQGQQVNNFCKVTMLKSLTPQRWAASDGMWWSTGCSPARSGSRHQSTQQQHLYTEKASRFKLDRESKLWAMYRETRCVCWSSHPLPAHGNLSHRNTKMPG